jgi:ABC-type Mn2+/Zn2+ transport system permease subunit
MKATTLLLRRVVLVTAMISVVAIIADSVILNFYGDELFLAPEFIPTSELIVMAGAVVLGVFILLSELWLTHLRGEKGKWSPGKIFTAFFGFACLVLLYFEREIADRIGWLMLNGDEYAQQLSNLQMLFAIQLVYVLLIVTEIAAQGKPTFAKQS